MLRIKYLLMLALLGSSLQIKTDESSFDQSLGSIEHNLVVPQQSYGFDVSDIIRSGSDKIISKKDYKFYTDAGRVYYQVVQYDPQRWDRVYGKDTTIKLNDQPTGEARTGSLLANHQSVLSINVTVQAFLIGEADIYLFGDHGFNLDNPASVPWQLLANPCFAPLRLNPVAIRSKFQKRELPDENGNKIFELTGEAEGAKIVLRLAFAPDKNYTLVQSDMEQTLANQPDGKPMVYRFLRQITGLTKLENGQYVPQGFVMKFWRNGVLDQSLERKVTNAVIGQNVPAGLFDFQKQFSQKWDSVIDAKTQIEISPNTMRQSQ